MTLRPFLYATAKNRFQKFLKLEDFWYIKQMFAIHMSINNSL